MLTHLQLRNFAVVTRLDIEFKDGLTVLTGETGAGKSILIDALSLTLGERASHTLVRPGYPRAEVVAVFEPRSGSSAESWLRGHQFDDETGECVLRRCVVDDGRSRAYINGRPVPVQVLRSLGECLVDVTGQHAHQSLLRRHVQRDLLDTYAGDHEANDCLAACHRRWKDISLMIDREDPPQGIREDRQGFLAYQVREIEALNPSPNELDELLPAHRMLSHSAELLSASARAVEALDADDAKSAIALAGCAAGEVSRMSHYLPETAEVAELIEGALIQLNEAASGLRRIRDHIEADPDRLALYEARLSELHSAARKHRVDPRELASLLDRMRRELECATHGEARLAKLREQLVAATEAYLNVAQRVHQSRARAARALGAEISASLRQLGMEGARFRVDVKADTTRGPSPHGTDQVDFLVSANPGQPLRPVSQVASGGELSRIGLAIRAFSSGKSGAPTLIFDEVDAGIGAQVGSIVGKRLRALSRSHQILCVTHLPQIASQAHHHLAVTKHTAKEETSTATCRLVGEQRVREIARMLGGAKLTGQSLAHAREMLSRA